MPNQIGLFITIVIVALVLIGIVYGSRYLVKKLISKIPPEKKTLKYVVILLSWPVISAVAVWTAFNLIYLLGFNLFYNPFDMTECFSSLRTESIRMNCIERHISDADDISICNSIEGVQVNKGKNEIDEYFVSRDRCILTLIGFYYTDISQLKHKEWCYELSAESKMADGRSLVDGCLSKFE